MSAMRALRWNWLVPFVGGCIFTAIAIAGIVVRAGLSVEFIYFSLGIVSIIFGLLYRRWSKRNENAMMAAAAADLQAEQERADS